MSSHFAKLFVIFYIDVSALVVNGPCELNIATRPLALLCVACAVSHQPIYVTAMLGPGFHF